MPEMMTDSLKHFLPLYHLPQFVILGMPLLARPFNQFLIIWPPLGSIDTLGTCAAMVIISIFSFGLPKLLKNERAAKRWALLACLAAFGMFVIYISLVGRYVIRINTPFNGVYVRSVGFTVSPDARAQQPNMNNAELLKWGGLEEESIEKVWTPASVLELRLCLLITFTLMLGFTNFVIGAVADLQHKR